MLFYHLKKEKDAEKTRRTLYGLITQKQLSFQTLPLDERFFDYLYIYVTVITAFDSRQR